MVIYENANSTIEVKRVDIDEAKVLLNGEDFIMISAEEQEEFIVELTELLDNYRI